MQLLAGFLIPIFTGLFTWLAQYFTKRAAVTTAVVAAVGVITGAFYSLVQGLLNGIGATITDSQFLMVWWAVWPSNGATCLAACFGADIAGFLWRYQKRTIEMIAGGT